MKRSIKYFHLRKLLNLEVSYNKSKYFGVNFFVYIVAIYPENFPKFIIMKSFISNPAYLLLSLAWLFAKWSYHWERNRFYRKGDYRCVRMSKWVWCFRYCRIKRKNRPSTDIVITLNKTFQEKAQFLVHLHLGDMSTDNADVAASLQPVAMNGVSETLLTILADESKVTFEDFKQMDACIKIHFTGYRTWKGYCSCGSQYWSGCF